MQDELPIYVTIKGREHKLTGWPEFERLKRGGAKIEAFASFPATMTDERAGEKPMEPSEPIAWRYDCIKPVGDRDHLDPPIAVLRRLSLDPDCWIETPLYSAQALADAKAEGAREEREKVVAWIKAENELCDCHARSEGECACGAWYGNKSWPFDRFATAIEKGAHHEG